METQAYFSNISFHISAELKKANSSIYVAVAWFTDTRLFSILCDKAKAGLDVQLIMMDDDINRSYGVTYSQLEACGGKVHLIDGDSTGTLMHNKFCVIDRDITITGSYNWSNKAQSNHENITITSDSSLLAESFLNEFRRIKVLYHGNDPLKSFDAEIIIKRLQIIDNLIQLNETDQVSLHVSKINEHQLTAEVQEIVDVIAVPDYDEASILIKSYLVRIKSITHFHDEEIEQLKWEIKYLEIEIVSLESEKASIEKIISDFVHAYTIAFGDLLLEILRLKKEKLGKAGHKKKAAEFAKAEEEYARYEEQFKQAKKEDHFDLNDEEKDELKKKYRQACVLCHPDKFQDEEMKQKAHKVFVELQEAYSKNDLRRVREILTNLENGNFDIDSSDSISSKEQLLKRAEYLRNRRKELAEELLKVRNDKSYRDVITIKSMDTFFDEEKERLEKELNSLKNEQ